MDFTEICLTIPCLEMALDHGYSPLDQPQSGAVQAFKTHFWHRDCPYNAEAKYIYVTRDPMEASTSFYHFMEGWCFEEGTIGVCNASCLFRDGVEQYQTPSHHQTNRSAASSHHPFARYMYTCYASSARFIPISVVLAFDALTPPVLEFKVFIQKSTTVCPLNIRNLSLLPGSFCTTWSANVQNNKAVM